MVCFNKKYIVLCTFYILQKITYRSSKKPNGTQRAERCFKGNEYQV